MKVRSIITLVFWIASMGAPFLSLQADACEGSCCITQVAVCATEAISDDCPGMQDASRLHPIPPVPINTVHGKAIQATVAASLTMPLELSLAHPTIQALPAPLRLPPPPTHLLI